MKYVEAENLVTRSFSLYGCLTFQTWVLNLASKKGEENASSAPITWDPSWSSPQSMCFIWFSPPLSLSLSLPLATHSHEMWSSGISKPCRAPYSESLETWSLLGHLEFTRKLGVYSDIWSLLGNLEFTRILGVYSDTWSLLENLEFTRKLGVYSDIWSLLGHLEFTRKLGVYSKTWSLLENLEFKNGQTAIGKCWFNIL